MALTVAGICCKRCHSKHCKQAARLSLTLCSVTFVSFTPSLFQIKKKNLKPSLGKQTSDSLCQNQSDVFSVHHDKINHHIDRQGANVNHSPRMFQSFSSGQLEWGGVEQPAFLGLIAISENSLEKQIQSMGGIGGHGSCYCRSCCASP